MGDAEVIAEMIKAVRPLEMQWLYKIMRKVWKAHERPDNAKKKMIVPIYKKGDKNCHNCRGITLLNHCYKMY